MNLLMISGDRQIVVGEQGPFYFMQAEFSRYFDRIDVICPQPNAPIKVSQIHGNVNFHPADVPSRGMQAFVQKKGAELLNAHGHSLIVSHDYGRFANGRGAAWLAKKFDLPHVSELHHIPGEPIAESFRERLERFLAKRYVSWAKHRVTAFRVVNPGHMPRLLQSWGVPREKIAVLPSQYLDLSVYSPGGAKPEEAYDLVFVGRMVNNKGLARIIGALEMCRSRGQNWRTLFVGKGPLRESMRKRAEASGLATEWVEWVDSPEDLAGLYRASRAVVCASTCEGGPRFTVEAMACGVPCISTPVGIMEDLLADGAAGRLCGFDVSGLAHALDAVLGDEPMRQSMGERAEQTVQVYEYSRAIEIYANGLRRLAKQEERKL
ncbi:MAG: glycosyltransferase involved in cell wall biosynthesis [Planctomycetota bacterium]|jgi:glycosyltransferase involved in cell wall biosynthesis